MFFDLLAAGRLQGRRGPSGRREPRPDRLLPDAAGRHRGRDRGPGAAGTGAPQGRRRLLLRRARPPLQPAAGGAGQRRRRPSARPWPPSYSPDLAAMLIFLNRTGFNGLFRLNRRGGFNVPAGRYTEPTHLRRRPPAGGGGRVRRRPASRSSSPASRRPSAKPARGDFVYCDPPYAPLSRTASFANYTADGFGADGPGTAGARP